MLTDETHTESFFVASSEYQYWDQAQEVAPDTYFDYIHPAFRAFAQKTKNEVELGLRQKWQETLNIGRKLLEAKQVLTRRKEYSRFRESLSLTAADARKFVKLVEVFGDWEIERLLVISGVTSLFALCQAKYASVVSRLREVPEITKELVKRLIEEARTVQALPVPKAQAQDYDDAVLEKHVDRETGNLYYTLKQVNLSDRVGSALAAKLETHTIGQVLATLVEVTDEYLTSSPTKLLRALHSQL